jgi:anti-anti-sigma regulatory factor
MPKERIETSIMASLSELRDIEKQRIADEREAVERARQAAIDAKRAEEQSRVDAEEARKRAEREEIIKIQLAQAEREKQARLRVEAAEAAERMRLQAELDAQRMAAEMELRREEVARKRPTWMLAVTGVAFVAAIALAAFSYKRSQETNASERAAKVAEQKRLQAEAIAREAQEGLDKLKTESDERAKRVAALEVELQGKIDAARAEEIKKKLADEKKAQQAADHQAWLLEQKRIKDERNIKIDVSGCVGQVVCKDTGKKK